jgi:hypothetical protein
MGHKGHQDQIGNAKIKTKLSSLNGESDQPVWRRSSGDRPMKVSVVWTRNPWWSSGNSWDSTLQTGEGLIFASHATSLFAIQNLGATGQTLQASLAPGEIPMKSQTMLVVFMLLLAAAAVAQSAQVLPEGTEIKVRTDTPIPARPAANTKYTATVSDDVMNNSGSVAIPQHARAQLEAIPTADGKDTNLDLHSVAINGHRYLLTTQNSSKSSAPGGLGVNKRTGKYVGGGAAVGAVLGAIFGGGKGAAIGALVGGAGGAGAQAYTGRKKEIPAETELKFKLAQDLQMRSAGRSMKGLQPRTSQ